MYLFIIIKPYGSSTAYTQIESMKKYSMGVQKLHNMRD